MCVLLRTFVTRVFVTCVFDKGPLIHVCLTEDL